MTNVLARCAVVCSLLLVAGCGGGGGSNNVNTGVCAAGEFRCSGDVLETCSVDRTGFTTVATCQAGLCDAAGKQCDNCKAGEGTCMGAAAGKLCSADGQKLEDVTCSGDEPYCVASGKTAACVACRTSVDCSISSNPCQLSVCSAEGTCGSVAVAADTACSAGGGKCDGVGNCRECAAGEKRCSGIQPQSCGADGKWVTALACASPSPLCLGGDCVQCAAASDCPASANPCTQAVCSNGTCGYTATAQGTSCAGGTCNGAGQCNACAPGSKVCNGNQVLSCNSNGQYDPPSSCGGSTPYCENSTGSCVQCTSVAQCTAPTNPCLQAACTGNACGVSARQDGTVCAVGNEAGTCQAGTCTLCSAGQTRCQPGTNIPQSCSAGLWVGSAACASPTALCNAGACVECITGANCQASSNACLQAVCSSGVCGFSAKAQGTACSGGTCNGTGQCNACTPNSSVCNGNQILTCGSNGQYAAPTTCSSPTPYCDGATTSCVQCTSAAHCNAPTNPCLQATCSGGSCGVSVRADGTACSVSGDSGTCSAGSCAVCTNGATRCKPGVTTTPQVCSGGQWADQATCSGALVCLQGSCTQLPQSCAAILASSPGALNGLYDIDPDLQGSIAPVKVFCDMTGGGWTLAANIYDSAGDDAPNTTDYVVSGWQQTASGQWVNSATTIDKNSSGTGSSAVSLAFIAALKSSAGQQNLKMCFVHQTGYDTVCRSSADGSMALVSYPTGNPKLTAFSGNTLAYTYGRLAGLAGSADGYSFDTLTNGGFGITRAAGSKYEFGTDALIAEHHDSPYPAWFGIWHGFGYGMTYRPSETDSSELRQGQVNASGQAIVNGSVVADPSPISFGFRLYIGP